MAHQHHDIEVGFSDVLTNVHDVSEKVGIPHSAPSWILTWEEKRPIWLMELFAEFTGTFFYVYFGVGATASLFVATAAKEPAFGSLLSISIAYGLGIVFGLLCAAPTSGGHLSPGFTISFWLLKGFPGRKVIPYCLAQIFGSFVACISVHQQFKSQLDAIHGALMSSAAGRATIFTALGTGGVTAIFPTPGISNAQNFFNEFMCSLILTIIVYAVLDHSNPFVNYISAPFIIGFAYAAMIVGFALDTIVLNTARSLGGSFSCAVFYGTQCFTANSGYSAIGALTNVFTAILGGLIYMLVFQDSSRPILHTPATSDVKSPAAISLRAISRDNKFEKDN